MIAFDNKGFTLVEGLLLVLVVSVVGSAGYYVWNSQNEKEVVSTPTGTSQPSTNTEEQSNNETDEWYLYKSKGGEYQLRLANGLTFEESNDSPYLSLFTESLSAQGDAKAAVIPPGPGRDGVSGMFINYYSNPSEVFTEGEQQAELKTMSGLEVKKYFYEQTTEPDGLGLVKDAKQYTYVVTKNGRALTVTYSINPGVTSQLELVEKMVKTIDLK